MSFTVRDVMERTGSTEPGVIIEFIRDAFRRMAIECEKHVITRKIDIVEGKRSYVLPSDLVGIVGVRVLNEEDATELITTQADRDFSGTNNWTNTDFASFNSSGDLSVTCDSANQSCYLDVSTLLTAKLRYRLEYDATIASGTFRLKTSTGDSDLGAFESGTNKVLEFESPDTDTLKIVCTSASGLADFDNLSLMQLGLNKYLPASEITSELTESYFDEEVEE